MATGVSFRAELAALLAVPGQWIGEILGHIDRLPETNYRMGCEFAQQGLFKDAIFRLKFALWLRPQQARAWYVLGTCYYARGDAAQAVAALQQALRLDPDNEETLFMMAIISPKHLPEGKYPLTMPRAMAIDYFQRIADSYELQQREMGYVGHVLLDNAVRKHLDTRQVNFQMLDLGCGTGLTGYMLSDIAGQITGVDFCRAMLDHAMHRRRKHGADVYDRTILEDLRDYVRDIKEPAFDLVTASHVFNFVGDLSGVFPGAAQALREGGLFAFQVEPYAGQGFTLLPGLGRFGHGEPYIRALAERHGFDVLELSKVNAYPNHPLDQYVLKKR